MNHSRNHFRRVLHVPLHFRGTGTDVGSRKSRSSIDRTRAAALREALGSGGERGGDDVSLRAIDALVAGGRIGEAVARLGVLLGNRAVSQYDSDSSRCDGIIFQSFCDYILTLHLLYYYYSIIMIASWPLQSQP